MAIADQRPNSKSRKPNSAHVAENPHIFIPRTALPRSPTTPVTSKGLSHYPSSPTPSPPPPPPPLPNQTLISTVPQVRISPEFTDDEADFLITFKDEEVGFKVHTFFLKRASTWFKDKLQSEPAPLFLLVDESPKDFKIMLSIIYFIYPTQRVPAATVEEAITLFNMGHKYGVELAVEEARKLLISPQFLDEEPLRIYITLCTHPSSADYKTDMNSALRATMSRPLMEMADLSDEVCPGEQFKKLLQWQRRRAREAKTAIKKHAYLIPNCKACDRRGCSWWSQYRTAIDHLLEERPTSESLWDEAIINEAIAPQPGSCTDPRLNFLDTANLDFITRAQQEIDKLPWEYPDPEEMVQPAAGTKRKSFVNSTISELVLGTSKKRRAN